LEGPADISRRHFYLRQDPESREFYIQDVSKFGTAVNGKKLGAKEWVPLPSKATIVLADKLTIEFQRL
jgi:predicted component of type VI protein secretion system